HADHHRGQRPVRPDAATRGRAPGRLPVSGSPRRAARPQRETGRQIQQLGCSRPLLDARRGTGPLRSLMIFWPALGTRVMVRYRRPEGSVPPLTDAVGHLLAVEPVVRLQTKTGAVVECSPADVVVVRVLTFAPVRTSDIRALEHAAAMAWPGVEHAW